MGHALRDQGPAEEGADGTDGAVIEIVLEDVARPWWQLPPRRLGRGAARGVALVRPVGRVLGGPGEDVLGPVFPHPITRDLPDEGLPEAAWPPSMATAIAELRARLTDAGWSAAGRGSHPWSERYRRVQGR